MPSEVHYSVTKHEVLAAVLVIKKWKVFCVGTSVHPEDGSIGARGRFYQSITAVAPKRGLRDGKRVSFRMHTLPSMWPEIVPQRPTHFYAFRVVMVVPTCLRMKKRNSRCGDWNQKITRKMLNSTRRRAAISGANISSTRVSSVGEDVWCSFPTLLSRAAGTHGVRQSHPSWSSSRECTVEYTQGLSKRLLCRSWWGHSHQAIPAYSRLVAKH